MNRIELKAQAKQILHENLTLVLLSTAIVLLAGAITGAMVNETRELGLISLVVSVFTSAITIMLSLGYLNVIRKLINGEEVQVSDLLVYFSERGFSGYLMSLVMGVVIAIGFMLFIIPGVMLSVGLCMSYIIYIEYPDIDFISALRKSWDMMNGYKLDYFVLMLSFILWSLLVAITAGIAAIYVGPYIAITQYLYFLELKERDI